MNIFDIICIILLAYGAFQGFRKGLIIEITSLIGLFLGVYLAIYSSDYAAEVLKDNLKISQDYIPYLAMAATFIVVVIAIHLLGKLLTKIISIASLGLLNKIFGLIVGIAKNAIVICVIVLIFDNLNKSFGMITEDKLHSSITYKSFVDTANTGYNFIINKLKK